jgi:hypothetical protein
MSRGRRLADMKAPTAEDWRRVQARSQAAALHAPRSVARAGPMPLDHLSVADLPRVPDGG